MSGLVWLRQPQLRTVVRRDGGRDRGCEHLHRVVFLKEFDRNVLTVVKNNKNINTMENSDQSLVIVLTKLMWGNFY